MPHFIWNADEAGVHFAPRQDRPFQFIIHATSMESQVMRRSKVLSSVQPMLQVTRYHPCISLQWEQWMAVLTKRALVDHQMVGFQYRALLWVGKQWITLQGVSCNDLWSYLWIVTRFTLIWRSSSSAETSKHIHSLPPHTSHITQSINWVGLLWSLEDCSAKGMWETQIGKPWYSTHKVHFCMGF